MQLMHLPAWGDYGIQEPREWRRSDAGPGGFGAEYTWSKQRFAALPGVRASWKLNAVYGFPISRFTILYKDHAVFLISLRQEYIRPPRDSTGENPSWGLS